MTWIDNWGLPILLVLFCILFVVWIYVVWMFAGYLLAWVHAPVENIWVAQVVITILICCVTGAITNKKVNKRV